MEYLDKVYGKIEITDEPVLELIKSPALQRLKEIDGAGYFEPYFPDSKHNRFDHSLGVFVLLKKYGATLEEQIAGLIHDVSHSAFSHCIDYALDCGSQTEHSHQDNVFEDFVKRTEIPKILERYKMDIEFILDDKNFPLKETKLPDLCADRIDYVLRDALAYRAADPEDVKYLLDNLIVEDGKWIFKDFASAKKFAQLFKTMNEVYYAGLPTALMFQTVGDYLRHALQNKYISEEDLYTTDQAVIDKVNAHIKNDEKLNLLWDRMNYKIKSKKDAENYDAHVFCKSRIVDPLCRHEGKIKRISEIEPEWKEVLAQESMPKEYFIRFEK